MKTKTVDFSKYDFIIKVSGALLILIYTIFNRHPVFWDEKYYLSNLEYINRFGIGKEFILNMWGPAGPLYPVVHYLLKPLTGITVPYVRLVNVFFLIIIIIILQKIFNQLEYPSALNKSLNIICIPMIFVCSGMALTEMPAMFFAVLSMYFLLKIQIVKRRVYLYSALSGFCLSLAILGRQPYLLLIFPSVIFFLKAKSIKDKFSLFLYFICALCLPYIVFSSWGKLQPLKGSDVNTGSGLAPWYAIMSFGYAALITVLICPNWFYRLKGRNVIVLVSIFILSVLVNLRMSIIKYLPMTTFIEEHFTRDIVSLINIIFPCLILIVSLYFIFSTLVNAWNKKEDLYFLFFTLSTLLLLFSSIKISHQFSSRYVAQSSPFFVLMLSPFIKDNYQKVIGSLIAVAIGFASLNSFFN